MASIEALIGAEEVAKEEATEDAQMVEATQEEATPDEVAMDTIADEAAKNEATEVQGSAGMRVQENEATKKWKAEPRQWGTTEWMRQCSKHLHNIEGRLMQSEYMGHEVVRRMGAYIEEWCPPPRGDHGWLLRKGQDTAVRFLRQLTRIYMRDEDKSEDFLRKAMVVVRFFERLIAQGFLVEVVCLKGFVCQFFVFYG